MQRSKNSVRLAGLVAAFICLVLQACSYSSVFDDFAVIPEGNWHYQDTVKFEMQLEDTMELCDFFVVLRHDNDYHYNNFITFIRLEFPNGRARLDTVEMLLASPSGKWLGSGFGDIYTTEQQFFARTRFPMKGTYKFQILHAMRDELLLGVNDIGIAVRKAKK
ncbi:MAG: gliding motility lipoprotein GldH [Flavobacteriales bacterium]|nr:gliding motility lipoprotein GldH [Flavobacteriales bacterium]